MKTLMPKNTASTNNSANKKVAIQDDRLPMSLNEPMYPLFPEPRLSGVGNKVWFDSNGDGKQDVNEAGIGGIHVYLMSKQGVAAVTTTNAMGEYRFMNVEPGVYKIKFMAPSETFAFTKQDATFDYKDSDADMTGSTAFFELKANEVRYDIDAGLISKSAPELKGSIGDRIWLDSNGNGMQDIGEKGVAGVKVSLVNADMDRPELFTSVTDQNGQYHFDHLPAGNYRIYMDIPDGYQVTKHNVGMDDKDSDANAQGQFDTVTLLAGEHINYMDAGLVKEPQLGNISGTAWNDKAREGVHGVQDSHEVGLAKIGVKLFDVNGALITSTVTDAKGNYQFKDVQPGEYFMQFDKTEPLYATQQNIGNDTSDSDINRAGYTAKFKVEAGQHVDMDAGFKCHDVLEMETKLGGNVWFDRDRDGKHDLNEHSLNHAKVKVYDAQGKLVAQTETDKNGNYEVDKLKAGEYKVHFTDAYNIFKGTVQNATIDSADSDIDAKGWTSIKLALGETNTDLDAGFVLPLGPIAHPELITPSLGSLPRIPDLLSSDSSLDGLLSKIAAPVNSVNAQANQVDSMLDLMNGLKQLTHMYDLAN